MRREKLSTSGVVFLASPRELDEIYGLMAQFTADFLARGGRP